LLFFYLGRITKPNSLRTGLVSLFISSNYIFFLRRTTNSQTSDKHAQNEGDKDAPNLNQVNP